ncbi:hypothetical protein Hanom_Chr05g00435861 [Helianthus anomalus]
MPFSSIFLSTYSSQYIQEQSQTSSLSVILTDTTQIESIPLSPSHTHHATNLIPYPSPSPFSAKTRPAELRLVRQSGDNHREPATAGGSLRRARPPSSDLRISDTPHPISLYPPPFDRQNGRPPPPPGGGAATKTEKERETMREKEIGEEKSPTTATLQATGLQFLLTSHRDVEDDDVPVRVMVDGGTAAGVMAAAAVAVVRCW